jgi:Peptidase family S51
MFGWYQPTNVGHAFTGVSISSWTKLNERRAGLVPLLVHLHDAASAVVLGEAKEKNSQSVLRAPSNPGTDVSSRSTWMKEGLLISSFSDGLLPNPIAHHYLKQGLLRAVLRQEQATAEAKLEESVKFSPCNGPDMDLLARLEQADANFSNLTVEAARAAGPVRFLYIPTAMYALRTDSTSPPGRQRQRARADAKQRRSDVVNLLRTMFNNTIEVCVVTLDLDDGSLKQPEGDFSCSFPATGRAALRDWKPHLLYVQGGNTFWFYHCMEKGDWKDDLLHAIPYSFYIGSSAGAILAGASMETATWKGWDEPHVVPGRESYEDWKDVSGLGLIGENSFFPHYTEDWEDTVRTNGFELNQRRGIRIISLRDDQVLHVNGTSHTTTLISGVGD